MLKYTEDIVESKFSINLNDDLVLNEVVYMDYKKILETYVEKSNEGIIISDENANIIFFKESNNITGARFENPINKNILEVFPYLTKETSTFYNVLKNKEPIINKVQSYKNKDSKKVTVLTSTIPIIEDGKLVGAFELFKDLTLVTKLSEEVLNLQKRVNKIKKPTLRENGTKYTFSDFKGESEKIKLLINRAKKISSSSSPVLVYGETGTGKELLVQSIHNEDIYRKNKPFIAQNCAALPQNLLESILFGTEEGSFTGAKNKIGLFELANGGTLYLDEINSMDISLQGKLLRVIQEGEIRRVGGKDVKLVDVRIIASTNENPKKLLEEGRLRHDLYYRLNVIYLKIPSLIERKEDIIILSDFFINKYNKKLNKDIKGLSTEVLTLLFNNPFKGNIRELEHIIESAMNWCEEDFIEKKHIINYEFINIKKEEKICIGTENIYENGLSKTLEDYEREIILKAIKKSDGNYSKAARLLKVPKQTLQNKIKKYDIKKKIIIE